MEKPPTSVVKMVVVQNYDGKNKRKKFFLRESLCDFVDS